MSFAFNRGVGSNFQLFSKFPTFFIADLTKKSQENPWYTKIVYHHQPHPKGGRPVVPLLDPHQRYLVAVAGEGGERVSVSLHLHSQCFSSLSGVTRCISPHFFNRKKGLLNYVAILPGYLDIWFRPGVMIGSPLWVCKKRGFSETLTRITNQCRCEWKSLTAHHKCID